MVFMKKQKTKKNWGDATPTLQEAEPIRPITQNRKNIFRKYCAFIEGYGHIPSQREFADYMQMSPSGLREHLEAIASAGYLLRWVLKGTVVQYIPVNLKLTFAKLNVLVKEGYVHNK